MKKIKTLSKIHIYLSLPVGIIISVICLTGAVMVLYKDIHKLTNPKLYCVEEVKATPLPMTVLVDNLLVQTSLDGQIQAVEIFDDKSNTYQFKIENERGIFFVDQYTGEFLGRYDSFEKGGIYRTMFYMHRWLMHYDKEMPIGKTIVGISTIALVLIIITGFFIWLPRGIYSIKKGLTIKTNKGWKRFWYDLHVAGGVYISGWLLVLALTGLMWSFAWYRPMVFTLFGIEHTKSTKSKSSTQENEKKTIIYASWDNVLSTIRSEQSNLSSASIRDGIAYVYNRQYGNTRAYDTYNFNKDSGDTDNIALYNSRAESSRFMGWMYAIHVGSWGGIMSKILTFIVTLVGGILPITGYYFWIKKEYRKRARRAKNASISSI